MPTLRFFNLPQDKQQRILKAAKKEFTNAILPKALVSNIVKEAKISRGSFYDYFESLEDLFIYLINKINSHGEKCFSSFLVKTNNNYFEALKLHYEHILDIFSTPENRQFNLNVFASLTLLSVEKNISIHQFPFLELNKKYDNTDIENIGQMIHYKVEVLELLDMLKWASIYNFLSTNISANESFKKYCKDIDLVTTLLDK